MTRARKATSGAAALLLAALLAGAAAPERRPAASESRRAKPPRPDCTLELRPGAALAPLLERAAEGARVCLAPGEYPGPLRIRRRVTLWGPPDAVVRSRGVGTTVEVLADGTKLLGFTVDGSGGRFDTLDAAVRIEGRDVRVEGLGIRRAVFGLLVEKSERVTLRENEIHGTEEGPLGLRGDPIRLWETRHSRIENNRVLAGRDVVIWYSSHNRISGNLVTDGRYGTHLMYSHENEIVGNRYERNVVGTFLMYSRNVVVKNNLFLHSGGAAGMGLGLKESGNLTIADNVFVNDTVGIYVDTSPLYVSDRNRIERNAFVLGSVGVVFHGSERHSTFTDNLFRDNVTHVRVEGQSDPSAIVWRGNYFDDYAGYDLDRDGRGDIPYQLRSLSSDLIARQPELEFLRGTPALWLIDAIAHIAPLFSPRTLVVDPSPRIAPPPGVDPARGGPA